MPVWFPAAAQPLVFLPQGDGVGCCVGVGFGSSVGSTAFGVSGFGVLFGTAICGGCVPGAGLCSAADCKFSACADSVSDLIVAVLFTALSLLSETEADERSSGSVRSSTLLATVSMPELSCIVCGRFVFAQPDKETINAAITAIILAFFISQTSFALSLYGSLPKTAKLPPLYYLFFREVQVVSRG